MNSYTYSTYCGHRLPCGYCALMEKPCPMQGNTINPRWDITCNTATTDPETTNAITEWDEAKP